MDIEITPQVVEAAIDPVYPGDSNLLPEFAFELLWFIGCYESEILR